MKTCQVERACPGLLRCCVPSDRSGERLIMDDARKMVGLVKSRRMRDKE
jgi:hypothetical protein